MSKRKVSLKLEAFPDPMTKAIRYQILSAKNTTEFTPGKYLTEADVKKILDERRPQEANYVDDIAFVQPKDGGND